MNKFYIILISIALLNSCDCYQTVSGTVIDKEIGKPLTGVKIYSKEKDWIKTTTDTLGYFELANISGGFRCPPMTVIAELEDYQTVVAKIPSGTRKTLKMPFDSLAGFSSLWEFFDLLETTKLKVISHHIASFDCGIFANESVTIGTTENGDSIRVLELCNNREDFNPNDMVRVLPAKKPNFDVLYARDVSHDQQPRLDKFDFTILKTTYGKLNRIEK